MPPAVVHRSQLKACSSLISVDRGVCVVEILPDTSPSTSAETSVNSRKSLAPENHHNFTGKSSQDSKVFSAGEKGIGSVSTFLGE